MRLLLDTNVFVFSQTRPRRLGAFAAVLADPANDRLISVASAWEIAIKCEAGKLALPEAPATWIETRMRALLAESVPITLTDAVRAAALPPHHRDPFDRMIVAQAQQRGFTILTSDAKLAAYDVPVEVV